jgi:histidyl-tRNA synthetase
VWAALIRRNPQIAKSRYLPAMQPQALPGFRDFYPEEFALRDHIMEVWRRVATRYGFVEFDGPPLESLDLYTAKSGEEIVDQLYAFQDKGGREVALRPEMTPTVARMVAARAGGLKKPIRWFSVPQLFRYERQQRGRLREHFQLNCDLIGEPGPMADAELIGLALDVMREFGLGPDDVRVRLSDRRLLAALLGAAGVEEAQLPAAYQAVDKIDRVPQDKLAGRLAEAGLSASVIEGVFDVAQIRGLQAVDQALADGALDPAVADDLRQAVEILQAMGLGPFLDVDLSIVRGLAYYTGIVFEVFDAAGAMRAICGGGRYDGLLATLGGVDLPALGFGMGDVVLADLLRERGLAPAPPAAIDAFIVTVTAEEVSMAIGLAHSLRDRGVRLEYALGAMTMGKQLKLAHARGARFALVIGPDERQADRVVIRDLATGVQQTVSRSGVGAALDAARAGQGST